MTKYLPLCIALVTIVVLLVLVHVTNSISLSYRFTVAKPNAKLRITVANQGAADAIWCKYQPRAELTEVTTFRVTFTLFTSRPCLSTHGIYDFRNFSLKCICHHYCWSALSSRHVGAKPVAIPEFSEQINWLTNYFALKTGGHGSEVGVNR